MGEFAEIEEMAKRFRQALETLTKEQYPSAWKGTFPKGTCGEVALMLGAYLNDKGIEGLQYICGERADIPSHAWLARVNLCIDITADQFSDAPGSVVVANPSPWHATFTWSTPNIADFREYMPQWEMERTYQFLKAYL